MLLDYKIFLILGIPDQGPLFALIANVWATSEYDSIHLELAYLSEYARSQ